ncbi:MAG TPA: 16S rRNA (cytosine(1402)-N(4))-methyltransferase RsmH [Syntrophales bacterium]|nr:16S rRNA (cytosine(1402)-N(4))-methyltransferase RsmH [Syntrophales bacterium]
MNYEYHKPVMVEEVVRGLDCGPGKVYVDGTAGGGGHSEEILKRSSPDGKLIGIDLDRDALAESGRRLAPFGKRAVLVAGCFSDMPEILDRLGIEKVDGILLDLGLSSHQLDTAGRGFSFTLDGPLDMRFDCASGPDAGELVNRLPEKDLARIIREFGEEPMAGRVARSIVQARRKAPLRTTRELADLVYRAVPARRRRPGIHPATKTFQALRIAVNSELDALKAAVEGGIDRLRKGGRFCVISFHSLEDRIVKDAFRSWERDCVCPPGLPFCSCSRRRKLRVLTRKPLRPPPEEIRENPRARSAKLRIAERI